MRIFYILILALLLTRTASAQTMQWTIYDTTNSPLPDNQVQAIAIDQQNVKWIGTSDGLARLQGTQWTIYTMANAPLPSNAIYSLAFDKAGRLWIGTDKGLTVFDGVHWQTWNAQNSPLLTHIVNKLVFDTINNILWISNEKAVLKYDGSSFTRYDANNSLLFDSYIVNSLAVDKKGTLWIGAFDAFQFNGRLLTFDGINWDLIKLETYELTSTFPYSLVVDAQNKVWMGTGGTTGGVLVSIQNNQWQIFDKQISQHIKGAHAMLLHNNNLYAAGNGLTIYNGKEWQGFDTRNSPLPDDYTYTLAADKQGNIWTGTIRGGIAVYGATAETPAPTQLGLRNYPNPFRASTTFQYELPSAGQVQVSIYNATGQLIEVLENENRPAGNYTVKWNSRGLNGGLYYCRIQLNNISTTKKFLIQ